jgi:O-antigen/teichoic acid export membrane protein
MESNESTNTYRSLLKYIGLFGSTQALNQLAALVRNKLTALLIGPSGLGVLSLFLSANQTLGSIGELGLSTSGVREVSAAAADEAMRLRRTVVAVRTWGAVGTLLATLLCLLGAPWLSRTTFGDAEHVGSFRLLALAVAIGVQFVVEQAVLKGLRRLREVAAANLATTLLSVVTVVPLYYLFGEAAIVPAIVLTTILGYGCTARYSLRFAPPEWPSDVRGSLREGWPMMKLGFTFMAAAGGAFLVSYLIRTYIASRGSYEDVGFYNTGYVICCSYMGIILTSIDFDYFTRLSALQHDREASSALINNQIELSLMLVAPLLTALLIGVELAVRILYSEAFLASAAMIVWAWLFVYLRGANLSLSYIALSRSDKRVFLTLEMLFCILLLAISVAGFRLDGVRGLGIALSVDALLELLTLACVARRRYAFRFARRTLRVAAAFLLMPLGAFLFVLLLPSRGVLYWSVGSGYALLCLAMTWRMVRRRIQQPAEEV